MPVAGDLDLEPVGEGVDALGADAVEAAGVFVGALAEFAAGVEVGEHEFDGGDLELRVHVHGDAAAIVADGAGAVDMDGDLDAVAVAGEVLVDGVVKDLEDAMVEAALIGGADVHAGALADAGEAFELVDLRGVVEIERDVGRWGKVIFALFGFGLIGISRFGGILGFPGVLGLCGIVGLLGHKNWENRKRSI